jgi:DNA-binding winged helix-turn-helix (wHTH) protein
MDPTSPQVQTAQAFAAPYGTEALAFGRFRLHPAERLLLRDGAPVTLGGRAFDILAMLVQRAGQVVRHSDLIAHVWSDVTVSPGALRVHLTTLRRALGDRQGGARYIANVAGRGYCFVTPVQPVGTPDRPPEPGRVARERPDRAATTTRLAEVANGAAGSAARTGHSPPARRGGAGSGSVPEHVLVVAVGNRVTPVPPHRSRRAAFPHRALAAGQTRSKVGA